VVSSSNPARLQNGSGLRNQVSSIPSTETEDTLGNLQRIIATPLGNDKVIKDNGKKAIPLQKPNEPAEVIDFGGLSLQDFLNRDSVRSKEFFNVQSYSQQSVEECTSFTLPCCVIFAYDFL